MSEIRRAVVVGAGIGGLLSAAILGRHGYAVTILEQLGFPGGKFTSMDYHGFQVPTGALHLLPGGTRGPLYTVLRRLGATPEVRVLDRACIIREGGHRYVLSKSPFRRNSYLRRLPLADKLAAGRLLARMLLGRPGEEERSLADYLSRLGAGPELTLAIDKIVQFACGAAAGEASVAGVVARSRPSTAPKRASSSEDVVA